MPYPATFTRRGVLGAGVAAAAGAALPSGLAGCRKKAAGTRTVRMQLGWLVGNNQIGQVVAKRLGYFEEEKIDLVLMPGGPSMDGIAIVASGRCAIGQASSSPSLLLAVSQGIPIKCFAVGAQQHPYTFFSLPGAPIRSARALAGKTVGIQATGLILLSALLKVHAIPEEAVKTVIVGSDLAPLLTGQVDCITGWETNTTALRVLGPDIVKMRIWDQGVRLYAIPIYATAKTIETEPEMLAGFLRASGRGWRYVYENPEAAVEILVSEYRTLIRRDELEATRMLLPYVLNANTRVRGWGTFEPAIFAEQIALYDKLGQFSAGAPPLEAVMTTALLDATADARPKIG